MKDKFGPSISIRDSLSPNFDERPLGIEVDTVVLHATVLATMVEVEKHFADPQTKVSAHFTIDRDGSIVRHVALDKRAWHAGVSRMPDGRENVNHFSIGIELVNLNDGVDPYPAEQLAALKTLIKEVAAAHPIKFIVPHHEIAVPSGRKDDPKGFDLSSLAELIGGLGGKA